MAERSSGGHADVGREARGPGVSNADGFAATAAVVGAAAREQEKGRVVVAIIYGSCTVYNVVVMVFHGTV